MYLGRLKQCEIEKIRVLKHAFLEHRILCVFHLLRYYYHIHKLYEHNVPLQHNQHLAPLLYVKIY